MIKTKVIRKTKNIERLIKKIQLLKNSSVESGYFIEQGVHSTIGLTYTELMRKHEWGFGVPQRHLRLSASNIVSSSPQNKKELKNYLYTNQDMDTYLNLTGSRITNVAQSLFGVITAEVPSNAPYTILLKGGRDEPLVDTGELRDNWAYRTSSNLSIRGL